MGDLNLLWWPPCSMVPPLLIEGWTWDQIWANGSPETFDKSIGAQKLPFHWGYKGDRMGLGGSGVYIVIMREELSQKETKTEESRERQ